HLKTHKGWRDGPRDPDGKRTLIPPKGPDRTNERAGDGNPPRDGNGEVNGVGGRCCGMPVANLQQGLFDGR
ncbi:MAG: hypothetical protein WA797_07865, partial [Acidimicrobiales bacterium]